jgi:fluoroquinolone resistance protein
VKNHHEYLNEHFSEINYSEKSIEATEFDNCTFTGCHFSSTQFIQCKFHECHFLNCNLSLMTVSKCSFFDTLFEGCKAIGINWTTANWPNIKLTCPLQFNQCIVNDSSFIGLSLREMKMVECKAHDVDFREADFTQADFSHTDFTHSLFSKTLLTEANFAEAINYDINIFQNNVKRAKFTLPEAMNLLQHLDIELLE